MTCSVESPLEDSTFIATSMSPRAWRRGGEEEGGEGKEGGLGYWEDMHCQWLSTPEGGPVSASLQRQSEGQEASACCIEHMYSVRHCHGNRNDIMVTVVNLNHKHCITTLACRQSWDQKGKLSQL